MEATEQLAAERERRRPTYLDAMSPDDAARLDEERARLEKLRAAAAVAASEIDAARAAVLEARIGGKATTKLEATWEVRVQSAEDVARQVDLQADVVREMEDRHVAARHQAEIDRVMAEVVAIRATYRERLLGFSTVAHEFYQHLQGLGDCYREEAARLAELRHLRGQNGLSEDAAPAEIPAVAAKLPGSLSVAGSSWGNLTLDGVASAGNIMYLLQPVQHKARD